MKRVAVLLCCFFLFFLVACAPQKSADADESLHSDSLAGLEQATENSPENVNPSSLEPAEEITERPQPFDPPISEEAKKFMDTYKKKVQRYTYYFSGPPYNQGGNHFFISGDNIRINIDQSNRNLMLPYDTVFLDREKELAIGYCMGDALRCPHRLAPQRVSFLEYFEPLSHEWFDILVEGEIVTSMNIDNKKTKGLQFERNGIVYTLYVDIFSGLPLRVDTVDGNIEKKYHYKDLNINNFNEEYAIPPDGFQD